jgi:hypothetical protein
LIEQEPRECAWSVEQKNTAWENAKVVFSSSDKWAEDFYHFEKPASELSFWEKNGHCELIPPMNPNPKNEYLDGGTFVYFDKSTQKVLKVVPIAW